MKKILIVEDEPFLRKSIKELLIKNGYEVLDVSGKTDAMQYLLQKKQIDLYLVDVWLLDGDGFKLCKQIRRYTTAPLIFLTACDDEESIVKGLNMGADDYITKPFRTAELLSRIGANLRRSEMEQKRELLQSGDIILDKLQERVFKNKEDLHLSTLEFQLLYILMNHAEKLIKREVLLQFIWETSGKYVQDNTLSVSISRLRSKVGQEYIETIHGFGYRFTQPVYVGYK